MNLLWKILKVAFLALIGISIALGTKTWVMWNDAGQRVDAYLLKQQHVIAQPIRLTETESLVSMALYQDASQTARLARQAIAAKVTSRKAPKNQLERAALQRLAEVRLRRALSDEASIKAYLNTAYYGGEDYGLKSASRSLFGTGPASIGLHEAATLAALLRDPGVRNDAETLQQRADLLLDHIQERLP